MPTERLALYGTLRPGGEAHFHVRNIPGTWSKGWVTGWTYEITWGPAEGYPGITLDPTGLDVEVDILESDRLDKFWRTLDEYEGPGYTRVEAAVTADGTAPATTTAWIYETRPDAE